LVRKFVDSEFIRIFAPTESATLPIEQRTRAGLLFCSIMSNIYTKQPLSIDDQIAKLRSQGLIITDEDCAKSGSENRTLTQRMNDGSTRKIMVK